MGRARSSRPTCQSVSSTQQFDVSLLALLGKAMQMGGLPSRAANLQLKCNEKATVNVRRELCTNDLNDLVCNRRRSTCYAEMATAVEDKNWIRYQYHWVTTGRRKGRIFLAIRDATGSRYVRLQYTLSMALQICASTEVIKYGGMESAEIIVLFLSFKRSALTEHIELSDQAILGGRSMSPNPGGTISASACSGKP